MFPVVPRCLCAAALSATRTAQPACEKVVNWKAVCGVPRSQTWAATLAPSPSLVQSERDLIFRHNRLVLTLS